MAKNLSGGNFFEADVAAHSTAINAGMEGADPALDDAVGVVVGGEPAWFARAEEGYDGLAERGGQVGWKGVMAKKSVASAEHGSKRGNVGGVNRRERDRPAWRDFHNIESRVNGLGGEKRLPFFQRPLFGWQAGMTVDG